MIRLSSDEPFIHGAPWSFMNVGKVMFIPTMSGAAHLPVADGRMWYEEPYIFEVPWSFMIVR